MTHQTSRNTADAGYELQDSNKTSNGHGDRGKTGSPHVANETEREHQHLEQDQSQGHTGDSNTNKAHEQWTEVGGRTKGGTQKPTDKQSNSNGVGTRSDGACHYSDNHSIFGNRNGNRFGQDTARGPNMTTNTTPAGGMEHYRVNVGYVDVRFMCGNGKGFNVARGIKKFIAAARVIDKDFCLLPLGGQDNNLCIPADVPNSKEGILKYFRHRVPVNNVAGSIKIQTKFSISQLKHPSSTFWQYLNKERVHINSTQLGVEEGVTMGWCWKSHPAFGYRDEMKYHLKLMMGKAHEDTLYALFPKNIRYIRKYDGAKLSTTGIALRIAKRPGVSEQLFREELAQRWSNLSIKKGGSLASKFFIPFGNESTLGDSELTHIIEQQNLYLRTTKQRIVRNLNDINDEINFETHDDVNME
jgi:hypothetical protein